MCSLEISKPVRPQRSVAFRRIKNIDCEHFRRDIRCSALSKYVDETSLPDPNVSAAIYSSELRLVLDKHAPVQSKVLTIRSNAPWFTETIRTEKLRRNKLERRWRCTRLTVDREIYKT